MMATKMKIIDGVRYRPEDLEAFGHVTAKKVLKPAAARAAEAAAKAKAEADEKAKAEADDDKEETGDDGSGEQDGSGAATSKRGERPTGRARASKS